VWQVLELGGFMLPPRLIFELLKVIKSFNKVLNLQAGSALDLVLRCNGTG